MKKIIHILKKVCASCGESFIPKTTGGRPVGVGTVIWKRRKYCNKSCAMKVNRGTKSTNQGMSWKIKDTSNMKGKHPRSEFKKGENTNKKNHKWKDRPSLTALHNWVRRRVEKPEVCPSCKTNDYQLELANISQEYKRDVADFEWLCHMCHMVKDGRINNLFQRKEQYVQ